MTRRRWLALAGGTSVAALAGCLGDDSPTALEIHDLAPADGSGIPRNGDELPAFAAPSPLHDRTVTSAQLIENRHALLTFVFTRCHMSCPVQASALAGVQVTAIDEGFADDIVCAPITFDPAHDTSEQLRSFSEAVGADPGHPTWEFLRPASPAEAETIVIDKFGLKFEPTDDDDETDMAFVHTAGIILVNRDGLVERTYAGYVPDAGTLIDDTKRVVDHFS